MSPPDQTRIDDAVVDAITALGNPTRLEILLALEAAERDREEQWLSLSFTELYETVDLESTSQFSYHLDRLVGRFVAETADGYRLTYAGAKIVRTVRSGVYEGTRSFDDVAVDGVCVACGERSLLATVEVERFVVRCRSCESTLVVDLLPRSQTRNRSPSSIVASVGARIWSTYTLVRGDVCPECFGPLETAVTADALESGTFHALEHTCHECRFTVTMPLAVSAAFHPAAVGFLWDHGVSLLDCPIWEFFEYVATGTITTDVACVDPLEATFDITFGDDRLRLEMDESLTVTPVPNDSG